MKKNLFILFEILAVIVISSAIGAGIGWLQSIVSFRTVDAENYGMVAGVWVTIPLSLFLYFFILKRKIKFKEFIILLLTCLLIGVIAAYIIGPVSMVVTPAVLIVGALYIRSINKK